MTRAKVAITLEQEILERVDRLIEEAVFPNRSRAIEEAVEEKLERLEQNRLARECLKLDPDEERRFAEEGLSEELNVWPEY